MDKHCEPCGLAVKQPLLSSGPRAGTGRWKRIRAAARSGERLAIYSPLAFSLLAVLALLAISFVALQPSYDTNDDVFMTMIAAGRGFCPAPDEHLVFTNVIMGQALKRLYTAWPRFPWYGCYLLCIHYAAQVVVLYCALTAARCAATPRRRSMRRRFTRYLIYFGVVELLFLGALQFTTTAFLVAQAGIFLLLLAARRRAFQPNAPVTWALFGAVAFLVVAAIVRLDSLFMALFVAAPLGVFLARHASLAALARVGLAASVAAGLIVLAVAYDRASYDNDPRWAGFFRYNQLRVKFNDYQWTSHTPQTADVFAAIGWTKNDHEMIAHWFFDDPSLYSEANLRSILEARAWKTERLTLGYCGQVCRGLLKDRSVWAVVLVMPFLLAGIDRGRQARWVVLGCAAVAVGLVVLLTWNSKLLPMRVYFPLLSFPLSVALLFPTVAAWSDSPSVARKASGCRKSLAGFNAWKTKTPSARVVVVLLCVGLAMGVYHHCRRSVRVHKARHALEHLLADLRPDGRQLYVCWESAMPFELVSPLDNLDSWSRMSLVNLVWTQRTPWQEEIKARFGISNLAQAMCQRDDIVLVATPAHRSLFATFAKEHYQVEVEFVPSNRAGEKIVAGRFQRRAQAAEIARDPTGEMAR